MYDSEGVEFEYPAKSTAKPNARIIDLGLTAQVQNADYNFNQIASDAQEARAKHDKKTTPSAKRPATGTSTKITEAKVRRSARTTDIKSTKNEKKQSEPVEIEEDNESKEDEDNLEENAEADDQDEEEEPKISIARPAKKATGTKALTTAADTTPKLKRKVDKNSPDSWAEEAVSDQTPGIPRPGSLLHLLRKKQDQNELNKARARVKELEANVGNVQADLEAPTAKGALRETEARVSSTKGPSQ